MRTSHELAKALLAMPDLPIVEWESTDNPAVKIVDNVIDKNDPRYLRWCKRAEKSNKRDMAVQEDLAFEIKAIKEILPRIQGISIHGGK